MSKVHVSVGAAAGVGASAVRTCVFVGERSAYGRAAAWARIGECVPRGLDATLLSLSQVSRWKLE